MDYLEERHEEAAREIEADRIAKRAQQSDPGDAPGTSDSFDAPDEASRLPGLPPSAIRGALNRARSTRNCQPRVL
jgi:hypothetical protein